MPDTCDGWLPSRAQYIERLSSLLIVFGFVFLFRDTVFTSLLQNSYACVLSLKKSITNSWPLRKTKIVYALGSTRQSIVLCSGFGNPPQVAHSIKGFCGRCPPYKLVWVLLEFWIFGVGFRRILFFFVFLFLRGITFVRFLLPFCTLCRAPRAHCLYFLN